MYPREQYFMMQCVQFCNEESQLRNILIKNQEITKKKAKKFTSWWFRKNGRKNYFAQKSSEVKYTFFFFFFYGHAYTKLQRLPFFFFFCAQKQHKRANRGEQLPLEKNFSRSVKVKKCLCSMQCFYSVFFFAVPDHLLHERFWSNFLLRISLDSISILKLTGPSKSRPAKTLIKCYFFLKNIFFIFSVYFVNLFQSVV